MKFTTLLWLLGGLAAAAAWSATFTVTEGEAAVVHRFGAPKRVIVDAGLHVKWPAPIDTVARVDRRVHLLDPTPAEYLTRDQRNIIVDAFVAWRVEDPKSFLVRLRTREAAELSLTSVLKSSVTDVLNKGPIADLVSIDERERTLDSVAEELTAEVRRRVAADDSGVHIELAGIKRINFPQSNKDQIFERMRSDREQEAEEIRSRGRAEASDIRTRAETEVAERIARANEEALEIRGAATARAAELQATARETYPELVELLRAAELFDATQGDTEIIMTSEHPLLRVFDASLFGAPAPLSGGQKE
ncbi:MAG: protease modulator HflC [Planctomycetota bacterium]